jgi:hypothetical protein
MEDDRSSQIYFDAIQPTILDEPHQLRQDRIPSAIDFSINFNLVTDPQLLDVTIVNRRSDFSDLLPDF